VCVCVLGVAVGQALFAAGFSCRVRIPSLPSPGEVPPSRCLKARWIKCDIFSSFSAPITMTWHHKRAYKTASWSDNGKGENAGWGFIRFRYQHLFGLPGSLPTLAVCAGIGLLVVGRLFFWRYERSKTGIGYWTVLGIERLVFFEVMSVQKPFFWPFITRNGSVSALVPVTPVFRFVGSEHSWRLFRSVPPKFRSV
jgi:hypothetical protein